LVHSMFQASVSIQIGDGASARFWTDSWLRTGPLCNFAPNLFQAIGQRRRGRSVRDALTDRQWTRDITGALTVAVLLDVLKERNGRTFDGRNRTTAQVCGAIFDEISDCIAAGFNGLNVFAPDGASG